MLRIGLFIMVIVFCIYTLFNLLTGSVALEKAQASLNERATLIEKVLEESK